MPLEHSEASAFLCRTGRHRWLDRTSAARCCDPAWFRALLIAPTEIDRAVAGGEDVTVLSRAPGEPQLGRVWRRRPEAFETA